MSLFFEVFRFPHLEYVTVSCTCTSLQIAALSQLVSAVHMNSQIWRTCLCYYAFQLVFWPIYD
jgi:hypothetical protein